MLWESDMGPDLAILIPYNGMVYMQWARKTFTLNSGARHITMIGIGHPLPVEREFLVHNSLKVKRYDEFLAGMDRGIEEALDDGVKEIVFLDSDVIIPDDGIMRLRFWRYPFVTGIYYERNKNHRPSLRIFVDGQYRPIENIENYNAPFFVDACGLGFTYIDAYIFKRLSRPWFKWDDFSENAISEDIYFSQKVWNELGIKPLVDPGNVAKHIGPALYGKELEWTAP